MLKNMPCGKEKVVHYTERNEEAAEVPVQRLEDGTRFGFAEVDIEIPKPLWPKIAEMCPFIYNKEVPGEAVPQHMLDYVQKPTDNGGTGKSWWVRCPRRSCLCTPPYALVHGPRGNDHGCLSNN